MIMYAELNLVLTYYQLLFSFIVYSNPESTAIMLQKKLGYQRLTFLLRGVTDTNISTKKQSQYKNAL